MSIVTVDQTTLYGSPDRSSPVGPLRRGAVVIVIGGESDMTQTLDGWVPSSDVAEAIQPWIAEVSDSSAALYAKPNAQSDILRDASQGDLVRVTGVSPGIDGNTNLWWATTDGYVGLHSISSTGNPLAQQWTLPAADDATRGWWGTVKAANVRAAPTTDAPIVGEFSGGEHVKVLSDEQGDDVDGNATWYRIDGGRFAGAHVHSSLIERQPDPEPSLVPPDREVGHDPWIVVDRAASTLTLLLPMDARPCGSCNVLLPATLVAGTYEFRLFSANSYQLPATSLGVPSRQLDATTVGSACRRGTGLRATHEAALGIDPGCEAALVPADVASDIISFVRASTLAPAADASFVLIKGGT